MSDDRRRALSAGMARCGDAGGARRPWPPWMAPCFLPVDGIGS